MEESLSSNKKKHYGTEKKYTQKTNRWIYHITSSTLNPWTAPICGSIVQRIFCAHHCKNLHVILIVQVESMVKVAWSQTFLDLFFYASIIGEQNSFGKQAGLVSGYPYLAFNLNYMWMLFSLFS